MAEKSEKKAKAKGKKKKLNNKGKGIDKTKSAIKNTGKNQEKQKKLSFFRKPISIVLISTLVILVFVVMGAFVGNKVKQDRNNSFIQNFSIYEENSKKSASILERIIKFKEQEDLFSKDKQQGLDEDFKTLSEDLDSLLGGLSDDSKSFDDVNTDFFIYISDASDALYFYLETENKSLYSFNCGLKSLSEFKNAKVKVNAISKQLGHKITLDGENTKNNLIELANQQNKLADSVKSGIECFEITNQLKTKFVLEESIYRKQAELNLQRAEYTDVDDVDEFNKISKKFDDSYSVYYEKSIEKTLQAHLNSSKNILDEINSDYKKVEKEKKSAIK